MLRSPGIDMRALETYDVHDLKANSNRAALAIEANFSNDVFIDEHPNPQ